MVVHPSFIASSYGGAVNLRGMDHYERRAIHDIQAWVGGDRGALDRLATSVAGGASILGVPLGRAFEKVMADRRVASALSTALERATEELGRFMTASTPPDGAARAYGLDVHADIAGLHLQQVDAQLARLRDRYRAGFIGMGAAEGAASFAGAPMALAAFAASIPAMQALSLRAVADISRHAGFDPAAFEERQFVAEVALRSLEVGGRGHGEAVDALLGLGQQVAARQVLDQLQQYAVVSALRDQAQKVGLTLTRRRAASLLPIVGAAVGAGFNAVHAERLLTGSTMLFRARHLARTHGFELTDLIEDLDPAA